MSQITDHIFAARVAASAPDWRAGLALLPTRCGNCSGVPVGDGCSHQCHNSPHYYSPERERADDVFYGDDDVRERYAADVVDAAVEAEYADHCDDATLLDNFRCTDCGIVHPFIQCAPSDPDDIPF